MQIEIITVSVAYEIHSQCADGVAVKKKFFTQCLLGSDAALSANVDSEVRLFQRSFVHLTFEQSLEIVVFCIVFEQFYSIEVNIVINIL